MENQNNINVSTGNYYNSSGRKIGDFFIGFIPSVLIIIGGFILISSYIPPSFLPSLYVFFAIFIPVLIILPFIFYRIGRKFITFGIIIGCAIMVLLIFSWLFWGLLHINIA